MDAVNLEIETSTGIQQNKKIMDIHNNINYIKVEIFGFFILLEILSKKLESCLWCFTIQIDLQQRRIRRFLTPLRWDRHIFQEIYSLFCDKWTAFFKSNPGVIQIGQRRTFSGRRVEHAGKQL